MECAGFSWARCSSWPPPKPLRIGCQWNPPGNSTVKGDVRGIEAAGLRLAVVKPNTRFELIDRVIPYQEISRIRLDLGPRRGWQIAHGLLGGFLFGAYFGLATANESPAANRAATNIAGAAGGLAGWKLGSRHRKG